MEVRLEAIALGSAILFSSFPTFAVSGNHVRYLGGTAPGVKTGVIGTLDTTSASAMVFHYQGKKLSVPYRSIEFFQHTSAAARHLGVLPAIVVGLVKARQKRHFFRIIYSDENFSPDPIKNVVILEVPKGMASSLESVLDARAPRNPQLCNHSGCWR